MAALGEWDLIKQGQTSSINEDEILEASE